MTYLAFLLIFIIPPIALFASVSVVSRRLTRIKLLNLTVIAAGALLYTTAWDNYLVWKEIWGYGPGRVIATIGYVPVEEYLFFLLQPILVGLMYYAQPGYSVPTGTRTYHRSWKVHAIFLILWGVSIVGLFSPETLYLALILVWCIPVLWVQWIFIGSAVFDNWGPLVWTVVPASIFLWLIDGYAIRSGIWYISDTYTTGFHLFGLPLEEATFFFVTSCMVVLGLRGIDMYWVIHRKRQL